MTRTSLGAAAFVIASAGMTCAVKADVYQSGYLFVSDYGASVLDRYKYSYDQTTNAIVSIAPDGSNNNPTNATFLGSATNPVKEGIQGTANDLILVGGNHGTGLTNISRYTLDGHLIGNVPVNFSAINGGNVSIGNIVATPDGKFIYAPLQAGNQVVKISLTTGAIVSSYAFSGAHDVVLLPNGHVLAANYAGSSPQVVELTSDLTQIKVLLNSANAGVSNFVPTGMTYDPYLNGGALIVNNNARNNQNSVLAYTLSTDSSGNHSASFAPSNSYIGSATHNKLDFIFGSSLGPDGQIYIAALGGGGSGGFSVPSGYVDGVYAFNPLTGDVNAAVNLVIPGYTEKNGPAGASGLVAPKYLQFSTNFIPAGDAGYNAPEPATMAVLAAGLAGLAARRRRRAG